MRRIIALVFAWLLVAATNAHAYIGLCCAKCGGNMPMNIPGGGIPETHEFRFKIQPMFMTMPGLGRGTGKLDPASILGMPAMGYYMAAPEKMDMKMLNLAAGYSFTDDFFAGVMAMYLDLSMPMRFNPMMRTMTGRNGFTMRSRGWGDTMLMAKYRLFADDPLVPSREASLFFGLSIPTGSISKRNTTHPVPMRRKELLPYTMQLGTGTWDPTLGVLYQRASSPWWWGVNARYTTRLGKNRRGWAFGDVAEVDGYLMFQPHYAFVVYGEAIGTWQGKLKGEADEAKSGASGHAVQGNPNSPYATPLWDPAFSGRTRLEMALGLQWQPRPLVIVDFMVKQPVYERVSGIQMRTGPSFMLTFYLEVPTSKSVRALTHTPADEALGF